MNLAYFQSQIHRTCQPEAWRPVYLRPGLCATTGHICGQVQGFLRHGIDTPGVFALSQTLGEALWYTAEWAAFNGLDIPSIELAPHHTDAPMVKIAPLEALARATSLSACAFAAHPEMESLTNHIHSLERLAHALGDNMEGIARMALGAIHMKGIHQTRDS